MSQASWINPQRHVKAIGAKIRATQRHEHSRDVAYARPYFASIDSAPRRMKPARLSLPSTQTLLSGGSEFGGLRVAYNWPVTMFLMKYGFSIGAVKMRRRTGGK